MDVGILKTLKEEFVVLGRIVPIFITVLIFFSLVNCGGSGDNSVKMEDFYELSKDPMQISKKDAHIGNVQLWGIKIGDPESKIPKDKIYETNESGWRMCAGGVRYRVKDGKIIELRISADIIEKITFLNSEAKIQEQMGPADKVKSFFFDMKLYIYKRGKITIVFTWKEDKKKVESIRVIDSAQIQEIYLK